MKTVVNFLNSCVMPLMYFSGVIFAVRVIFDIPMYIWKYSSYSYWLEQNSNTLNIVLGCCFLPLLSIGVFQVLYNLFGWLYGLSKSLFGKK